MNAPAPSISVVIPTYRREKVLLDTIDYLMQLDPGAAEILIVDQTEKHSPETADVLAELASTGKIRWLRLTERSIPHAMNEGLIEAQRDVVLFLDDDVIPGANLIGAHARAHEKGWNIVAGQVLQPGEEPDRGPGNSRTFRFCSSTSRLIVELMGGNFSTRRDLALELGGFDENFVHAAYRFEADFAARALAAGEKILFEPEASIRHLKAEKGGTRAYGNHLTTIKPSHAVGDYYYLLRARQVPHRVMKMLWRPLRAVRTRHHLTHPWWIPGTLVAEAWGFVWAVVLALRGPRLLERRAGSGDRGRMTGDLGPEAADRRLSSVAGPSLSSVVDQSSSND